MSLLLDALKRAEQEKLARTPAAAANAGGMGAHHAPRAVAAANASALELQPIAASGATHSAPGRADSAAHAAQNVFQAKSVDPPGEASRNRNVMWATFGAIALVAIAAAAYVWYSVKSLTPQYAGTPRQRATPPITGMALPPPAAMGTIVPAPSPAAEAPYPMPPAAPTPAPASGLAHVPATVATPAVAAAAPETPAERLVREAASAPQRPPRLLERTPESRPHVPAEIATGYRALREGDAAGARRSYQAALASEPTNVDAHLGMATLAAREGNRAVAAEHYRRALDLDPRNATAAAGLAMLADFSRPEALEAKLVAELARAPESPALHFSLGTLYASQSLWRQAQASFYEAHRLDPGSAEIAYNLAVSLDHLGQGRAAAPLYWRALENSRERAVQFDTAAVARRLAELN